ncbi:glycosyltransferase family 39 protein, partial [Patescibacteria group bacterium]|nr:glycosyltransferase family 39 protein [Patescibacteria group bacterium]
MKRSETTNQSHQSQFLHIHREWYLLLGVIALWLVFRLWYLAPRFSDAHHVVYAGYLLTQGLTLYQDIFYTSPPLLPYLYAGMGRVFGFGWLPFNVFGILLTAVDALVLYALAAKWWSRKVGLLAATMFLFSFVVLATTDFLSDIHVTLTLILLGMLAYSREQHALSGVLFGLAALSKIYTVVAYGPLVLAYLVARRWRRLLSNVVAMAAVFGVTVGWLAVRHGGTFLALVFGDHLGKFGTLEGLSKSAIGSYFIKHDPWLILGAVVVLLMMALILKTVRFKEGLKLPEIHHLLLPLFLSAGFLSFFFIFPDGYYFYLKILAAWLALIVAAGIYYLVADDSPRWLASLPSVLIILAIISSGYLYLTQQAQAAVVTDYAAIRQFVDQPTAPDRTRPDSGRAEPRQCARESRGRRAPRSQPIPFRGWKGL